MSNRSIKIAIVQFSVCEDTTENKSIITQHIKDATEKGAELILLPELHNHSYFCQQIDERFFDFAESIPGPTTSWIGEIAKQHGVVIVSSLFERRAKGVYHNTAVVMDSNGEIAGKYRKMHIPDDPGYYEKYYFTPGDLGFTPIQTSLGKLGVLICWDQWFPEAARIMALSGAEVLLYPTAIGWDSRDSNAEQKSQLEAWTTIQRAHAIANGLPVAVSNRVGFEADSSHHTKGLDFWGSSFIADSFGNILTTAPPNTASVLVTEINLQQNESVRLTWPFLRDRRIDAYRELLERLHD